MTVGRRVGSDRRAGDRDLGRALWETGRDGVRDTVERSHTYDALCTSYLRVGNDHSMYGVVKNRHGSKMPCHSLPARASRLLGWASLRMPCRKEEFPGTSQAAP